MVSGALTLFVGVSVILWLGFGPSTCPGDGSPCYGLLGPTILGWLDYPAFALIWIPLAGVVAVGVGAIQNALGKVSAVARFRWAAVVGVALPTLLLLVASPLGVVMIPVLPVSYLTAGIGQLRARRGAAPQSVGGEVLGAVATIALVAVLYLSVQWLYLLLRA